MYWVLMVLHPSSGHLNWYTTFDCSVVRVCLAGPFLRVHGQEDHGKRFSKEEILTNVSIMKKDSSLTNLRILEALLIKKHRPSINRKDEGFTRTLAVF